jgi:DNA-directed RNA polymerase specialized sigma24 family protein
MSELQTEAADAPAMTLAEVSEALRSLTARQKAIVVKFARKHQEKTGAVYSAGDLIQETYTRALEGRRKWTRGVPAEIFLGGTIRSIADEWSGGAARRKDGAERPFRVRPIEEGEDFGDGGAEARGVDARIDLPRIFRLFDDDPIAQKMIRAMMDGLQGDDIENACGIYGNAYEAKRKKIRRRLQSFMEAGGFQQ